MNPTDKQAMTFSAKLTKINLNFNAGIHPLVYSGALTDIVETFQHASAGDISQLVIQKNDNG